MKQSLLFIIFFLVTLTISGQTRKYEYLIDSSNIKPWTTKQISDYQGSYHFSNSDLESTMILKIDHNSCKAQIQSGKWVRDNGTAHWVSINEYVKKVKIIGNKFYSDKTSGEFIYFFYNGKKLNGLMVYKPWSSWVFYVNDKGYEIGFATNSDIGDKE